MTEYDRAKAAMRYTDESHPNKDDGTQACQEPARSDWPREENRRNRKGSKTLAATQCQNNHLEKDTTFQGAESAATLRPA